jgi:hypothetical protein
LFILLQSRGTALGGVLVVDSSVFLTKRGIEKKTFFLLLF